MKKLRHEVVLRTRGRGIGSFEFAMGGINYLILQASGGGNYLDVWDGRQRWRTHAANDAVFEERWLA